MSRSQRFANAKKYLSPMWLMNNKLGELYRRNAIKNTLSIIQDNIKSNGVKLRYNGNCLCFGGLTEDVLNVSFRFEDFCGSSAIAYYDDETDCIVLNSQISKCGIDVYEALFHEYTHKIQFELCKMIHLYPKDSQEYQYLYQLSLDVRHAKTSNGAFGYNFEGDMYLDPVKATQLIYTDEDIINALYFMQLGERSAYQTGKGACDFLLSFCKNEKIIALYNQIHTQKEIGALQAIKNEFGGELTYQEICNIVDSAKYKISTKKSPTINCDTEALMMYNFATILKTQNYVGKDKLSNRESYNNSRTGDTTDRLLATYYESEGKAFVHPKNRQRRGEIAYTNIMLQQNPMPDADDLGRLSSKKQAENPKFIVEALKIDKHNASAAIKCLDDFKAWYFSEFNDLSERDMNFVASILGEEFEPSQVKQQKTQEAVDVKSELISQSTEIFASNEQYVFDGDISVFETAGQNQDADIAIDFIGR